MKKQETRESIKNEVVWFLVPTFILTYSVAIVGHILGGLEKFPVMAISMYIPASVVILLYILKFKKKVFRNTDLGLRFKGFKFWIIAPLLMFLIITLTYSIPLLFDSNFFKNPTQILEATEKSGFGVGHWGANLAIIFGMNILIAPIINILMFLGEEIGWRGFLVPRLIGLFGPKKGFLIGGAIWALWHAGGIFLGFNYPGHQFTGNLMMILMCIPLGVILQYLYFKSKSIFVPALAHGAINWTSASIGMFVLSNEEYNTMLYGPTGIIGIVVLSVIAIFLYRKMDWEKENTFSITSLTGI